MFAENAALGRQPVHYKIVMEAYHSYDCFLDTDMNHVEAWKLADIEQYLEHYG